MENYQELNGTFQQELRKELDAFLSQQKNKFPENEVLTIDLHCHDHNSDVPDELLGRILHLPETWLKTKKLLKTLQANGCNALTITNHNNARSCYELQKKGIDVLTAAEFSCTVPDFNIGIHVLTYGFNEEQEKSLNKLRKNLYNFLEFAKQNNIPTIWAHPLYYYSRDGIPPMDFFHKMALVFERFEVLNGQRDTWQNMLVKEWIERLTPELINEHALKYKIDPRKYCHDPYKKSFSGGSDSHMGIFSGLTGTRLYIPDLQKRIAKEKTSDLALEAIRNGNLAPFGAHHNTEKLTIAFLDYVFQVAMNMKDPGLMRILLHKGNTQDKTIALLVSNAFREIQHHKVTMNFVELFHNCFMGKIPSKSKRWMVPKVYKPIFDEAQSIAEIKKSGSDDMVNLFSRSIDSMSKHLNAILHKRLAEKLKNAKAKKKLEEFDLNNFMETFELPSEIRTYIDNKDKSIFKSKRNFMVPNVPKFLDGLSFPFLASGLILAANYTSARVLYNNRPLLETFSSNIGKLKHPKRALWLTDTFEDNNGVSIVLKAMHEEIKQQNLPIDILVCSSTLPPDDHLVVLKPLEEYTLPFYKQQTFRIPNFQDIHTLFQEGEYDRLICSSEGPMGIAAIYLKNAYSVKAHFYIHTDWLVFARKVLQLDHSNISRLRRLLRAYYHNFDKLFVLNTDQQKWLTSKSMGFSSESVSLTAHWVDEIFKKKYLSKNEVFSVENNTQILLFAGRVSYEKGVMELPPILEKIKKEVPDVQLVIAGSGPAEEELKEALPDAIFMGWVAHDELPYVYSAADLLILPSKFDTFSCVVLESLSCGLPVIAYKTKGPKDIIQNGNSGFLVNTKKEMVNAAISYFKEGENQKMVKSATIKRAKEFSKNDIVNKLLVDLELK